MRLALGLGRRHVADDLPPSREKDFEAYGSRWMCETLRRRGKTGSRSQVQQLMRAHGMQSVKRRGRVWRAATRTAHAHRVLDTLILPHQ